MVAKSRLCGSLILCIATCHVLIAQQVGVGPTVTISADAANDPHGESFIAINPKNSKNLLAASCRIGRDGAGIAAYVSHDGGLSWSQAVLPPTAQKVTQGWDVITYFDAPGNAYLGANDRDGLWITRSSDGGRTWSAATLLAGVKGFDRQYMGFDRTGKFAGRIYAGASGESVGIDGKEHSVLAISFSTDGGARTFSQPRLISSSARERIFDLVNMIVTPQGKLILPFVTYTEPETPYPSLWDPTDWSKTSPEIKWEQSLRLAISDDGGDSYSVSAPVLTLRESVDPNATFKLDKVQGVGNSAIDLSSGLFRGRMYVVFVDNAGDRHNIRVIHSSDDGKTWSKPVTVNDNTTPAEHANPTIAVNNRGVVGVTWNDRRNHKDECYDFYFSASLDGGETFVPNVTTGRKATCSRAPGNWVPRADISAYPKTEDGQSVEGQGLNVLMISTRFPGGGDTQGLDSDDAGVFHAAWIDGSSGVMQLAATTFTVQGTVQEASLRDRDVSTQVKLVAEQCGFDWQNHAFSCLMHLENKSPLPMAGPFTVELQNMRVNLNGFQVDNADNGRRAEGARWNFDNSELVPQAKTEGRQFRWKFTGVPDQPEYPFMMFKVVSTGPDSSRDAAKPRTTM